MLRELNELEYLPFAVGQPFNIASMMRIIGSLSPEQIASSLKKLQQKHPLLQTRIIFDKKNHPWLTSEKVGEIPVAVIKRKNDVQALQEFNRQLLTPFDFTAQELPLFRVVVFSSPKKSELIFCALHLIADGLSMTYFVEDFVKCIANPSQKIIPLNMPARDVDVLTPKIRRGMPKTPLFSYFIYFLFKVYNFLRFALVGKLKNPRINLIENEMEIYSWTLSSEQSKQFFEKCKNENVSVHSALCTAFSPEFKAIGSSVNIRDRLRYPVKQSFGFFSGAIALNRKYKKRLGFWENARGFQKELNKKLRDRFVFFPFKIIFKKAPYNFLRKLGALYVGILTQKKPFTINNLGSLDKIITGIDLAKFPPIETFYGGLTSFLNLSIILVYTINGLLHFHYHFPKLKFSLDQIKAQASIVTDRLLKAIQQQ